MDTYNRMVLLYLNGRNTLSSRNILKIVKRNNIDWKMSTKDKRVNSTTHGVLLEQELDVIREDSEQINDSEER